MRVVFQKGLGDEIVVRAEDIASGAWAEICSAFLAHGGIPHENGVAVSPLVLRLSAADIAQLIEHHGLQTGYDQHVRSLLRLHFEESQARAEAEQDLSGLPPNEVQLRVGATGRYRRKLTDQQMRDVGRLLKLQHGANFSVPGAGKTAALLACYEAARSAGTVDRLLVVAPKNAFLSWEDEVTACYPDSLQRPFVARLAGGADRAVEVLGDDPEVALITYQFLPNVLDHVTNWASRHRTHVVLDESHRVKSGTAGVYAFASLQLSPVSCRRDVLSGTPMPNAPEDLRAQMEFLWPGQRVLPEQRLKADAPRSVLDELQDAVRPLYVRTTKLELGLEALEVVRVPVELGPLQRELYELLRSEAKRIAAGLGRQDVQLLRKLGAHVLTMLQAASNPMLLAAMESLEFAEEDEGTTSQAWELLREIARSEQPAKIAKTIETTENILGQGANQKVLIWTSFVQNVHLLEKLLERHKPVSLYGAVATGSDEDADTREGRIRLFHADPSCRVMVANPAACGEGISLHRACHHAIYLDRTFNAAHYLQSIDRIHRLGLPTGVQTIVNVLEARWTIDARVATRLKAKIDSMSVVLNDPGLAALAYDPVDVVEEFPAGIQPEDVEEILDHIIRGDTEER